MQDRIEISTNVTVFAGLNALTDVERRLMLSAGKALLGAYAPYSEFKVGAAVLLENDEIILGNNQENAAYPSGLCAERVAFFSARANHPDQRIIAVAIQASSKTSPVTKPVSPCGGCRQVMAEYEHLQDSPIPMLFSGESGPIYRVDSVSELLPFAFNGDFLKKI